MRSPLALLVLSLAAAPAAAQATWTVDASGSGDFTSLASAVASPDVADGDTLLVEPGDYGSFVTGKALTIIGRAGGPRPQVGDESRIEGAASATLAGLVLEELLCSQIPGRVAIEGCDIGHTGIPVIGITGDTFLVEDCAEVVVSNGVLRGKTGDPNHVESPGVHVQGSRVALVHCTILGGKGGDGDFLGFPGQPGVDIEDASVVVVAGCTIAGGDGGVGEFTVCQAQAGAGIEIFDSTLWVFGDANDVIDGGHHCPQGEAFAIGGLDSQVTVSGVTLVEPAIGAGLAFSGTVEQPDPAQPFLFVGGDPTPGSVRRLNVHGPSGATALVFFSLQPLFATPAKLSNGPLWMDPGSALLMVPLLLGGQELPITLNLPLPRAPALAGVTAWVQGFVPEAGGHYLATNPASIVLRF